MCVAPYYYELQLLSCRSGGNFIIVYSYSPYFRLIGLIIIILNLVFFVCFIECMERGLVCKNKLTTTPSMLFSVNSHY